MVIGLISDTHGRFESTVITLFRTCDLIIHAGDIGGSDIIQALQAIAPVRAVRGNTDYDASLSELAVVDADPFKIIVVHDVGQPERPKSFVNATLNDSNANIVVYGHTHQAAIDKIGSHLFINPGSASKPRTNRQSAGILTILDRQIRLELHGIDDANLPLLWDPFETVL